MYLTCKCLNVSVKTRGDELKEFNGNTINDLTNSDCFCDFFKEPLATANELEGINKEQCSLVMNKNIDLWCIHRCINCSMYTHAVHRNHGAGLVLINKNMITTNDEIEKLKSHPKYSKIFKIIIGYNQLNNDDEDYDHDNELLLPLTKYSMSQLSNNIQLSLNNLQQQLDHAMQKKAEIIDEKIRAFTNEQNQLLEQYRERAHTEYNILSRIICANDNLQQSELLKTTVIKRADENNFAATKIKDKKFFKNLSIDTMDSNRSDDDNDDDADKIKIILNNSMTGTECQKMKREKNIVDDKLNRKKNNFTIEKNDRYDYGEVMFALEGMDDAIIFDDQEAILEVEESDAEDSGQDEGIHIPKGQRTGHPTLAKSLPVSVPNFSTFVRQTMQDSDDDQLSMDPFDPHNIRASIKALAKSVHGDAVFGDLPRPRFSTQI
ncbi:hypothetical protein PV325_010972 [Microctonus aethiopoides]|uniref:Uncharacterized protein n=1 Tax=Microctonus aethiopoides TaxID=144406 RepID=A0AA39F1G3_9HYME|nr:hypothetical protein PV325_010972 [Microctonus aethiopoides]KAK0098884.1 hypothetical protein PV326_000819 [Microctonus aethiopoides]KAK0159913.1 hypothetical protein PV328_007374 [Microctonus aethiopoides]